MSLVVQPVEPTQEAQVEEVSSETQEPAPFRAWEAEEQAVKETPASIPYSRFTEVNEERKQYRGKLEQAEAELAKFREREETIKQIKGPEDIRIEDYTDPEAYLRDLTKATKLQAILEVEERQTQKDHAKLVADQVKATNDLYTTNLNEAVKRNPDIKHASAWFDKHAANIHPSIAYELMIDENVGELFHDIATSQDLVREMFEGNTNDFIRKLHKMSARVDREQRYGSQAPKALNITKTPTALARDTIRESVPSTLRSSPASSSSTLGKAKSAGEYLKMKRAMGK